MSEATAPDRDALIEIVREIVNPKTRPRRQTELLATLEANVPHPSVSDLIFWPPDNQELTPEQIVDAALSYARRIVSREELVAAFREYAAGGAPAERRTDLFNLLRENAPGVEPNQFVTRARKMKWSPEQAVEQMLAAASRAAADPARGSR